jgi:voltage-gated sodium channel
VLRAFRLISAVPGMRRVVTALLAALPSLGSIMLLLCIVYYVASVIATKMFGTAFPDWFGDLGASAYSLFQIMTLESWSMGIVRPVMEVYPFAWAVFVTFILITSFTVLNLFIAVIVNAMQQQHDAELDRDLNTARDERAAITGELAALRKEVTALRQTIVEKNGF